MDAYASGRLGDITIPMQDVDHIIAIGSDRMMAAVGRARHAVLQPYLSASVKIKESHQLSRPMIHLDARHKLSQELMALHQQLGG